MKCRRCETENAGGMKFCGECGAPLALPPTWSATPDTDLDRPGAGGGAPQGERKLVTVLFADVAGFTTLAETLDPEPLRDLINACFDRLVPCVERYGGTVDKFIGDEIMALFGAPVAHENDAERAVRAALDMREALVDFNAERGTDLRAHFGINTGLVLAAAVGASGRSDYSVMGDAVNVAARLAEAAAPGEILVGPDTGRSTSHLFEFASGADVPVRGRSEPVTTYRLRGLQKTAQSRAPMSHGIR
ncbi:MAG: adenylate/guanylate cyclase domain-containing protein, partial [Thermoleophilia bacterium]|nr:adenylate/guanylate cyclase domain-containing protein [Thermoleophilia bacterium]